MSMNDFQRPAYSGPEPKPASNVSDNGERKRGAPLPYFYDEDSVPPPLSSRLAEVLTEAELERALDFKRRARLAAAPPSASSSASARPVDATVEPVVNGLRDSGSRHQFASGSVRDKREGKGAFELIAPNAEFRLALVYERGAKKYGSRNWEKGQPIGGYIQSGRRHIAAFLAGDSAEDHLAQAVWNLFSAMQTQADIEAGILPDRIGEELVDDLPPRVKWRNGFALDSLRVGRPALPEPKAPASDPRPEDMGGGS